MDIVHPNSDTDNSFNFKNRYENRYELSIYVFFNLFSDIRINNRISSHVVNNDMRLSDGQSTTKRLIENNQS